MNAIAQALSKFTHIALYMLIPIVLCFFVGKWIDDKLGTDVIFLFIFIILGVGSAFRNLYVLVIKDFDKERKKEEEKLSRYKKNE